jgi:hypothetical protein
MVNTVYGIVMAALLLFPWSLVVVMVGGSAWQRVQGRLRSRLSGLRSAPGSGVASSAGLRSGAPAAAQVAACR